MERHLLDIVDINMPSEDTQFKKGDEWRGNASGRPTGSYSITTKIIKYLKNNPEKEQELLEWLYNNKKDLIWNKIDANPSVDITSGGEKIQVPIYGGQSIIQKHNSDETDIQPNQED